MAIDASIYGNIRTPQIESPVNALAQVTQLRNAQNQNRLFDMKVAESEREQASQNALSEAYRKAYRPDGSLDEQGLVSGLAQGGFGSKIPGIQKGLADSKKAGYDAEKAKYESIIQNTDLVARTLAPALKNPALYPQLLAQLRQQTGGGQDMPDQFDPIVVQATIDKSLSTKDRAELEWKQKDFDYRKSNDAANRGVTIRGQNMIDDRARDNNQSGKAPAGYRWKPDGSLEAIPGGPAEKDATGTEGEKNAAGYGLRMSEAEKIIEGVVGKTPDAQKPGWVETALGGNNIVSNVSRSPERQKYRQAQEDWVRAKLRKESGAVIGEDEMDREIKTYFPQPGDKPDVIAQKQQSRRVAMDAMKTSAGKAGKVIDSSRSSGTQVIDFGSLK